MVDPRHAPSALNLPTLVRLSSHRRTEDVNSIPIPIMSEVVGAVLNHPGE
jgi:hypothetical protein